MKSLIIRTNDVLAYLAFCAVGIVAFFVMLQGKVLPAIGIAVGGWVVCSVLSGAWFLLSNINDNLQKIAERKP